MKCSVVTLAILVALLADNGGALECYSCNSLQESRCGATFSLPSTDASTCPSALEPATCYKLKLSASGGGGSVSIFQRGCVRETADMCDKLRESASSLVEISDFTCDTCKDDACNAAPVTIASTTMMFTVITAILTAAS